ncbi:hypothetical protein Zmor_021570 [Zophobas morio]|uniref:Uncharacterized protein n=1 Tax=Zophobas morio TaxID=2755281 RepID=A0AA38MBJ7_9CUCU|nr:hypothetical protein Zmor_021570 [Zophobas morio]
MRRRGNMFTLGNKHKVLSNYNYRKSFLNLIQAHQYQEVAVSPVKKQCYKYEIKLLINRQIRGRRYHVYFRWQMGVDEDLKQHVGIEVLDGSSSGAKNYG